MTTDNEPPPSYAPQAISDILPIYIPSNSDGEIRSYTLRQHSTNTQTITPSLDAASPQPSNHSTTSSYAIKTFKTGGFMNKKPHIIISRNEGGLSPLTSAVSNENSAGTRRFSLLPQSRHNPTPRRIESPSPSPPSSSTTTTTTRTAEGRFDIMGTGTTITYLSPPSLSSTCTSPSPPKNQHLSLESSHTQSIRTTIANAPHWWQPFSGNKAVLELTNAHDELVARFIYSHSAAGQVAGTTGAGTGFQKDVGKGTEIGVLQVVGALVGREGLDGRERFVEGREEGVEEVLCSAVVVVERARRRAANVGRQGTGYTQGMAATGGLWMGVG